ncbi:hypothetical protein E4U54_005674, partial [Claviceps lovelessii]
DIPACSSLFPHLSAHILNRFLVTQPPSWPRSIQTFGLCVNPLNILVAFLPSLPRVPFATGTGDKRLPHNKFSICNWALEGRKALETSKRASFLYKADEFSSIRKTVDRHRPFCFHPNWGAWSTGLERSTKRQYEELVLWPGLSLVNFSIDMISTAESKSNEMATASTFSYAQAAKGQGTVPSTTSPNSASQPQGTASPVVTETPVESSDGRQETEARNQATTEKQDVDSIVDSNAGSEGDHLHSETPHDRISESRRDDDAARSDRPWRQADKGTRSSSTATRSFDEQESRRPRKGKKSKASPDKQSQDVAPAADKTTKEPVQEVPKVELSEAPIPSVNIWLQRKEQQAKATPKATTTLVQDNGAKNPVKESSTPSSTPAAPKENALTNSPANGVKSNRKSVGDSGRSDRNGSRGLRSAEKDSKSDAPPSVEDAASWPTPEIAIKEEQKKPAAPKPVVAQDKDSQEDGSQGKRQKEKWVTYDYVPSVSFETQLPQMRNSKPRGTPRGVNSNRAAPSSTSTQPSEKTTAANASPSATATGTASAPAPATTTTTASASASANTTPSAHASKSTDSKERTKEGGATGSNRTNSLPPASKRATVDVSNAAKEQKKSAQSGGDKTKDAASTQSS